MVNRMLPAPVLIGREGQQSRNASDDGIGKLRTQKGPVAAVMHEDEQPYPQPGRDDRQRQHQPVGKCIASRHEKPQAQVRQQCIGQLPDGPRLRRLAKALDQRYEIGRDGMRGRY
jgi:hypothetical protein